jgi:hypothetical protein
MWELVDGFCIRTPITRNAIEDIWSYVPMTQKKYNSFVNVWDLNEEFDPLAGEVDSEYDSEDEFTTRRDDIIINPCPTEQLLREDFVDRLDVAVPDATHDSEPLDNLLFYRCGFISHYFHGRPNPPAPSLVLPWGTIRNILGDYDAPVEASCQDAVQYFVGFMLNKDENEKQHLRFLSDLSVDLPRYIATHGQALKITRHRFNDQVVHYFLQANSTLWVLVVDSALTAVECI